MAESWSQPFREFFSHVRALGTAGLGKFGIETGKHSLENAAAAAGTEAAGKIGLEQIGMGVAGISSGTLLGTLVYGGFGILSAITNQIEYGAARSRVLDFYREEIAAKLKKSPETVQDADLDLLAKGDAARGIPANATIAEKIHHEKTVRNIGIGASFIASLSVCGLIGTLVGGVSAATTVALLGATAAAPLALGLGVLTTVAKITLGVLAYTAIKKPLVKIGESILGVNHATTHDLVSDLARDREEGKTISQEQVVEIFIRSNPQIASYVADQYGDVYEHLHLGAKLRAAEDLANVLPIEKITRNINLGTANAAELSFVVQGDVSGALPKTPAQETEAGSPSFWHRMGHKMRDVVKALNHALHPETAHPIRTISAINHASHRAMAAESPIVEMNPPGGSFVERVGRSPRDVNQTHVEQLAERNAQQIMLPASPTLQ